LHAALPALQALTLATNTDDEMQQKLSKVLALAAASLPPAAAVRLLTGLLAVLPTPPDAPSEGGGAPTAVSPLKAADASAPPVVMGAAAQRKVAGAALALGHACAQWQVPLLAPGQP